jgi:hypothetical protein
MSEQMRVVTARFGEADSNTLDGYERTGGYRAIRKGLGMEPGVVIETVKESGLRGRGGAGFPTGTKWSFVPQDTGRPVYVVANFDESEPGTFNNRELIERDPHQFLEGLMIASYAVQCHTAFVYTRGEFLYPGQVLQRAIEEATAKGYFGKGIFGSDFDLDVVMHRGAGAYICGEETALLESIEGFRGQPRLRPPFPATHGLYASPTVVNNVGTIASVPHIVLGGVVVRAERLAGLPFGNGADVPQRGAHVPLERLRRLPPRQSRLVRIPQRPRGLAHRALDAPADGADILVPAPAETSAVQCLSRQAGRGNQLWRLRLRHGPGVVDPATEGLGLLARHRPAGIHHA